MQSDRASLHGRHRWTMSMRAVIVVIGAFAVTGCSGDGDGAPTAATAPGATTATTAAAPSSEASDSAAASSVATTSAAVPTTASTEPAVTETIATVPDERAPGLDSADGFCRGWSEFAGSFQALAFESAVGPDGVASARLEVIASGAVSAAAQLLGDEFPESIVAERDVFVGDVIGPFARRAVRATDELRAAGLSSDQIEQLGEAWLTALADSDADVDEPAIEVAVPDQLAGAVDAASAVFSADVPPIVSDPSLVTEAAAPATFEYLAENCPDQGILGGNDAIG